MGILYKAVVTIPELERQHLLDKLVAKGIKITKSGISIYELSKKELVREVVMMEYSDIDVEHDSNKYF